MRDTDYLDTIRRQLTARRLLPVIDQDAGMRAGVEWLDHFCRVLSYELALEDVMGRAEIDALIERVVSGCLPNPVEFAQRQAMLRDWARQLEMPETIARAVELRLMTPEQQAAAIGKAQCDAIRDHRKMSAD